MKLLFIIHLAFSLDPKIVESWKVCEEQKSQWSVDHLRYLKSTHQFYNPADPLDQFSQNIKKFDDWNQKQSVCHKNKKNLLGGSLHKEPHPSVVLVDELQKKIVSKIQKELSTQKNILENGIFCTSTPPPIKQKTQCEEYLNTLLPELNKRLKNMRALKSLADRGKPLIHDQPFTTGLFQSFYPSLWKKDSFEKLSPLTKDELELRSELANQITPEEASEAYYSLLSTTPALLFFDNQVNKENLNSALKKIKEQNHLDESGLLKKPPQELLLMADYVKDVISELPDSQKGDACLVVSEIYNNLKIQYETFPAYLAMVTGLASLASAPLKLFGKKILEGKLKKMAFSGSLVYGSMSYKQFQTYQRGVAFCSSQVMTNDSLKSKLCDAKGLNEIYENLQTGAVVSTGLTAGMGTLGLLRMAKNLVSN